MPVPLPDDPYVAVRQAQLVDTESEPKEAPSEAKELQSLGSSVPLMGEEFEAFKPSGTRTDLSHSSASSDSTTPLSLDHLLTHISPTLTPTRDSFHHRTACMIVRAQPVMSPSHSARVTEAMTLSDSAFRDELGDEDTDKDGEDESSDADDERESSDDEVCGLEGEGLSLEKEEEAASGSSGCGDSRERAFRTWLWGVETSRVSNRGGLDHEDGRVYIDIPVYVPPAVPVQTPPSLEWSSGSLPISPSSPVAPSPIASPVATPTTTILRLDAMPPTLFADIDRDVRELLTRSGAVRDEIFLKRYRLRSLKREQERVVVTFGALWRPVLALEAWAGQTDAQRVALWYVIYDIQRGNHDLRMQFAEERHERLKLADRVARIERRHESKEE
ncbi:hypothetical protein Tco_0519285 [Tanacetum coccineum]